MEVSNSSNSPKKYTYTKSQQDVFWYFIPTANINTSTYATKTTTTHHNHHSNRIFRIFYGQRRRELYDAMYGYGSLESEANGDPSF